jgi:preprotein translocase subunit Sss1
VILHVTAQLLVMIGALGYAIWSEGHGR